jgi:hypothetical protein
MAQIDADSARFRPSYRPQKTPGGLDPDMKRMGIVAAGIGGALAVVIGLGMMIGHHHHGVPVIEASAGPVRIKPVNAGGEHFPADTGAAANTTQALAPAAEQPQINALRAQLNAVKKQVARQAAETAAQTAAQTAQIAKLERAKHLANDGSARPDAARLAGATPSAIAAAPPVQRASATARIAAPDAAPRAKFDVIPPAQQAGAAVQLAAFTDEKAAQTGWETLVKKTPDLLGGRTPEILKAQAAGRTMWRLRTGGFTTVADAASFCAKMRDHGADCSIAAF